MNRRDKVVYISGKYSGTPRQVARHIEIAREYAITLWEAGFTVLCPHLNTQYFERDSNLGYKEIMDGDLKLVERSDILFMLPNWKYSPGARKERAHAYRHDRKVYIDLSDLLENE